MKNILFLIIVTVLTSCAAMQSAVDDTMDGVEKDTERLGNITETATEDVKESFNPARDVRLDVSSGLAAIASLEIRNLKKTSDWRNIAEIYVMGLQTYNGQLTAIVYNDRGTEIERKTVPFDISGAMNKLFSIEFSEGLSIKRDYSIKLSI